MTAEGIRDKLEAAFYEVSREGRLVLRDFADAALAVIRADRDRLANELDRLAVDIRVGAAARLSTSDYVRHASRRVRALYEEPAEDSHDR